MTHHNDNEVREEARAGRLRCLNRFGRSYYVVCDCKGHGLHEDDCSGLEVFNEQDECIGVFRGRQYRALRNSDLSLSVYSVEAIWQRSQQA